MGACQSSDFRAIARLVMPTFPCGADLLMCAVVCKEWRECLTEDVLHDWLHTKRFVVGADSVVGSQRWRMQMRRRAVLENLPRTLKPTKKFREIHGTAFARRITSIQGLIIVGDDEGGMKVWNPYRVYQWNQGKDTPQRSKQKVQRQTRPAQESRRRHRTSSQTESYTAADHT